MIRLLFAMLKSYEIIPEMGTLSRNRPGWYDYIKHLICIASFSRELWKRNYCPVSGHVHTRFRKTRAEYNYGIRQVKSKQY